MLLSSKDSFRYMSEFLKRNKIMYRIDWFVIGIVIMVALFVVAKFSGL